MIRIERLGIDAGYVDGGQAATRALYGERAADPLAGASAARAFEFSKNIYGNRRVKNALSKIQSGKCCYCESEFSGTYPGDVEHFRPKGRVRQRRGALAEYPGYFFLAYRWENLLFSCFICNSSGKGDFFPVANARATDFSQLDNEGALLVDPLRENPRHHITFQFITPKAISRRGEETIKVLRLDRPELFRSRISHLKGLNARIRLATKADTPENYADRAWATEELNDSVLTTAPFSSMSRDYLVDQGWMPAGTV